MGWNGKFGPNPIQNSSSDAARPTSYVQHSAMGRAGLGEESWRLFFQDKGLNVILPVAALVLEDWIRSGPLFHG